MRRRAAQRTPRLRQRRHLLGVGRVVEAEPDLDRFLHRDIAGRPGVGMAEAEQQIDVGGPRADAVQRRQRVVRGVGVLFRQHVEVQPLEMEFARDVLQRLDLGAGQAEPAEAVGAGLADGVVIERIERRREPAPDRRRARGRDLLAADDVRQSRKPRLALPQRRHAREFEDRLEPLVLLDQRVDGVFEVGLGVEMDGHCTLCVMRGQKREARLCAGLPGHPSPIVTEVPVRANAARCRHPFSDLRRARTAISISATPVRRC